MLELFQTFNLTYFLKYDSAAALQFILIILGSLESLGRALAVLGEGCFGFLATVKLNKIGLSE